MRKDRPVSGYSGAKPFEAVIVQAGPLASWIIVGLRRAEPLPPPMSGDVGPFRPSGMVYGLRCPDILTT